MITKVRRAWFNQPSSFQPYHIFHGTNVLVEYENGKAIAHFLTGDIVSMPVNTPGLVFSNGWKRP